MAARLEKEALRLNGSDSLASAEHEFALFFTATELHNVHQNWVRPVGRGTSVLRTVSKQLRVDRCKNVPRTVRCVDDPVP